MNTSMQQPLDERTRKAQPRPDVKTSPPVLALTYELRQRIEQKCLCIDMLTLMLNICIDYTTDELKDCPGHPPRIGTGRYGHGFEPRAAADLAERELRLEHFDLLTLLEQVPPADVEWYWLDCLPDKWYRRHLGFEERHDAATGRTDYVHAATQTTLQPKYRHPL